MKRKVANYCIVILMMTVLYGIYTACREDRFLCKAETATREISSKTQDKNDAVLQQQKTASEAVNQKFIYRK